ncbi:MAG: type II secretion system F family protein [Acidimicrobiales bacterium]
MVTAGLVVAAAMSMFAAVVPRPRRSPMVPDRPRPVAVFGARVRRFARRPDDPEADVRVGAALLWGVGVGVVLGPIGTIAGVMRWAIPGVPARRRHRRHDIDMWRELPESADLLALCLSAGLAVPVAMATVGEALHGPVAAALNEIDGRHRGGQAYAAAVSSVAAGADPAVRPLLTVMAAAHVDGGPALASLQSLAGDLRDQRRRRGEARARRVPVAMLFPLVFCILPAFVLLGLVPLIVGSAGDLSLP